MPKLKTINQILTEYHFLEYSTRKRNLAYQIQYLDLKIGLLESGSYYGVIKSSLIRDLVINITNILEYLLFVSLRTLRGRDPENFRFPSLVGQAKRSGLISKDLARLLNEIVELRNNLHPSKQNKELDINCFTKKEFYLCLKALNLLKNELKEFFSKEGIKVETEDVRCPYEGYSQVLFSDFICPYCGGYHI
ncbi:MAG: hypothetical protein WDL87_02020 [Candidatus Omnitrophota bacterium]|jgi:hypothetical protein